MKGQDLYYCRTCGKATLHIEDQTNHLLHLLLSVLTAGAWIIVWILAAASFRKPRCTICGTYAKYRYFLGYRRS